MAIGSALLKLLEMRSISQRQLAIHLGVSRQAVSRWCNNQADPTLDKLNELAKYLKVPMNDLFLEGKSLTTFGLPKGGENPQDGAVAIPECLFNLSKGDDLMKDWVAIPNAPFHWYSKEFFTSRNIDPDRCVLYKMDANSMEPTICNGDEILFYVDKDLSIQKIRDGGIYVFSLNGALKVKRLALQNDGIVVSSDNPEYVKEFYGEDKLDKLRIYGRVIEITRTL